MAGDWIKMRHDLADDPAVIALTSLQGVADAEHAVGKLHKLWSWADRQTKNGVANGVTAEWIDRFVSVENFSETLQNQGWLRVTRHGVVLPRFNRHNSETAKKRALAAIRQSRKRSRDSHAAKRTNAQPEKRREEKSSSSRSIVRSFERGEGGVLEKIDWEAVIDRCKLLAEKIHERWDKPKTDYMRTAEQWEMPPEFAERIKQASAIVQAGILPEEWLADAIAVMIETRTPKKKPVGWLGKVLASTASEKYQVDFDSFKRKIKIPEVT